LRQETLDELKMDEVEQEVLIDEKDMKDED
jgi:hypothetical protein